MVSPSTHMSTAPRMVGSKDSTSMLNDFLSSEFDRNGANDIHASEA